MKCKFKKSNGKKCGANAMHSSEFCWYHTPDISNQKKKLVSSKGGKGNSKIEVIKLPAITIRTAQDIPDLIIDAIQNVRKNRMEIRKGSVIGYLSNILLKAYEVSDMESRVEKIEKELEKLNPLNMF
jgi:hypothetical protein